MNEVQGRLKVRDEEKKALKAEWQARKEKRRQEEERRRKIEEERCQREEDRRQKAIERKERELAEMRYTEVKHLTNLTNALEETSIISNPLFESIETVEFLKRYCQK